MKNLTFTRGETSLRLDLPARKDSRMEHNDRECLAYTSGGLVGRCIQ